MHSSLKHAGALHLWLALALLVLLAGPSLAQSGVSEQATPVLVAGTVNDADGQPVADAAVRLEQPGDPPVATRSGANGEFSLSAPHAGTYMLIAEKAGARSRQMVVAGASGPARGSIDLVLPEKESDAPKTAAAAPPMEFADQPNFTVAGVTDWTAAGGHGSDATLRTSEALARETATLKPQAGAPDPAVVLSSAESSPGEHAMLEKTRARLEGLLQHRDAADLHRQLGEVDEKLGDPLAAVHQYELAVRLDPSEPNYFAWGSELLLHRAVWQAAEVFANGAKSFPNSERMLAALGSALFASARYDEAAQRLCEASDLIPGDPEPYQLMGKIEAAAPSQLPCVEDKLARFLRQQPGNALANYFYAMAILKRQKLPPDPKEMQKVEMLLSTAVSLDNKCAGAYLQLGLLSASRHNYDRAIAFYKQAIAADSQLTDAYYRLGVVYDRIGDAAKARQEFELHDRIEKQQADAVERQRREVKQFLVVSQSQPGH